MRQTHLALALTLAWNVCQAGSIDCNRSNLGYMPAQPWPFDHIAVQVAVGSPCVGARGGATCIDVLPQLLGARATIEQESIKIEVYGSDSALPEGVPVLAMPGGVINSFFNLTVGPISPGAYEVSMQFHDVDAQGNVRSCSRRSAFPETLTIRQATGPVEPVSAVEFYNSELDHYFVTADRAEIADLDSGVHRGWTRTGGALAVFAPGKSGGTGVPVCRFYGRPSAGLDSHFYTADARECAEIPDKYGGAWQLETANAFEVWLPDPALAPNPCGTAADSIFRAWNQRRDSNHRFTSDGNVIQAMLSRGYVFEGIPNLHFTPIAMCSPEARAYER